MFQTSSSNNERDNSSEKCIEAFVQFMRAQHYARWLLIKSGARLFYKSDIQATVYCGICKRDCYVSHYMCSCNLDPLCLHHGKCTKTVTNVWEICKMLSAYKRKKKILKHCQAVFPQAFFKNECKSGFWNISIMLALQVVGHFTGHLRCQWSIWWVPPVFVSELLETFNVYLYYEANTSTAGLDSCSIVRLYQDSQFWAHCWINFVYQSVFAKLSTPIWTLISLSFQLQYEWNLFCCKDL